MNPKEFEISSVLEEAGKLEAAKTRLLAFGNPEVRARAQALGWTKSPNGHSRAELERIGVLAPRDTAAATASTPAPVATTAPTPKTARERWKALDPTTRAEGKAAYIALLETAAIAADAELIACAMTGSAERPKLAEFAGLLGLSPSEAERVLGSNFNPSAYIAQVLGE